MKHISHSTKDNHSSLFNEYFQVIFDPPAPGNNITNQIYNTKTSQQVLTMNKKESFLVSIARICWYTRNLTLDADKKVILEIKTTTLELISIRILLIQLFSLIKNEVQ